MTQFGSELKRLRMERSWRQRDLVDALAGEMARSTLANVEAGRERPTVRLWTLIGRYLPAWRAELEPHYLSARAQGGRGGQPAAPRAEGEQYPVGGPFQVESVQFVYTFRHARSPEEIIEIRRVRALRTGARDYGLRFESTREGSSDGTGDVEALWGGYLTAPKYLSAAGEVEYLRRFRFGRRLRRGETHDFALRSWVGPGFDPDATAGFRVTMPTEHASIHLNFTGPERPARVWCWGPAPSGRLAEHATREEGRPLTLSAGGNISAHFTRLVQGSHYGVSWEW